MPVGDESQRIHAQEASQWADFEAAEPCGAAGQDQLAGQQAFPERLRVDVAVSNR